MLRAGVEVEGAGDGGEGGDAGCGEGIAGEEAGEAAAVGLAGCVDQGGVDAVAGEQVVEEFEGEGYVVDGGGGIGVALPLFCAFWALRKEGLTRRDWDCVGGGHTGTPSG